MDMFHLYQSDLPKGLEYVSSYTSDLLPWKHLNNTDPGLYSAIDPDAALRNVNWLEQKLIKTGQFQTWMNHYVRLSPVIISAGKRGNYIDIPYRDELKNEAALLLDEKIKEIQSLVPREVKPRKVYLTPPNDEWFKYKDDVNHRSMPPVVFSGDTEYDVVAVEDEVKRCSTCGAIATNKSEHFANIKGEQKRDKEGNLRFGKNGNPLYESIPNPCKGGEIQISKGIRYEYHQILDFNPNSSEQLKSYARFFGHPIGENKRDSTKESFDKDHIKTLIKKFGSKHPLYEKAAEISKLAKLLGTYIYTPDENNLIHTTYKNTPSTPRFSSANVNLQNVGKRSDTPWAAKARKQIIARPGYRFVQSDSSAIEAVVQGWWMGDANYMDLATKSIHAWVVAQEVGIDWGNGEPEIVDLIKHNYKDMYDKMKTTNYLTNFGGGAYLMWKSFPDVFPTQRAAEDTQNKLYARLPKLKSFHEWVRVKAHKESYLELPGWKHRHYYYDVFHGYNKDGKPKFGKDAKRVCAFFPQGCAAAFMRDNLLLMAYGDAACEWLEIEPLGLSRGWLEYMPANLVVHDGYTLEVPDGMELIAESDMETILTRPIPQLNGLRVGCETDISEVGGNWAPYDEVKNPMGLKTIHTIRVEVVPPPEHMRMVA
jgi:hypothetical protein